MRDEKKALAFSKINQGNKKLQKSDKQMVSDGKKSFKEGVKAAGYKKKSNTKDHSIKKDRQPGSGFPNKSKPVGNPGDSEKNSFDEHKAWDEFKKETGYKERKGSKEYKGKAGYSKSSDGTKVQRADNRKPDSNRSHSFGQDSKVRKEYPDKKEFQGKKEYPDKKGFQDKREYPEKKELQGKREYPEKKEFQGKKVYPGMNGFQGKREYPEKKEFQGKKEYPDKNGFQGKREYPEKKEFQGKKEYPDKKEFQGKKEYPDKKEFQNKKGYYVKPTDQGKRDSNDRRKTEYKEDTFVKKDISGKKAVSNRSGYLRTDKPDGSKERSTRPTGACAYIRECGSCNIMSQSYEAHLAEKQKTVDTLLKTYCHVEPIIGMEQPKNYRHKVHVIFDHDKMGNPVSGVYEEGTHSVVPIESCLIHNEKADAIIASIRGMLKSFKILTYDEDSDYGLLRHVMVRTGFRSGEIMVVLVLASPIMPSKNNFVKALRKEHPEITTIVVNVNDKKTSMVLGNKEQVIYGKGYIEDSLCGKTFHISPKSFYQVNPLQAEVIYNKAIEFADLTGSETVIDAYCGIGTIGIIAADHAAKVIGVELNKDAVRDAVTNGKLNGVTNVEFYNNDAGKFMSQMAEKKEHVDVVFMDPPRTGSNEQFMDALAELKPEKVVYISCNPITLERDLQYLKMKGYKALKAVPVDMFPWTGHVETVVLMSRVQK